MELKPEKGCVIEKLSSPPAKNVEALSSVKMTMVTLSADCYCGTRSLWQPLFAKGLCYFARVLSFSMKMSGVIHRTGQLFMAVHLIGYGSVPILCSVFYLSVNAGEAPDWQVIAIYADV